MNWIYSTQPSLSRTARDLEAILRSARENPFINQEKLEEAIRKVDLYLRYVENVTVEEAVTNISTEFLLLPGKWIPFNEGNVSFDASYLGLIEVTAICMVVDRNRAESYLQYVSSYFNSERKVERFISTCRAGRMRDYICEIARESSYLISLLDNLTFSPGSDDTLYRVVDQALHPARNVWIRDQKLKVFADALTVLSDHRDESQVCEILMASNKPHTKRLGTISLNVKTITLGRIVRYMFENEGFESHVTLDEVIRLSIMIFRVRTADDSNKVPNERSLERYVSARLDSPSNSGLASDKKYAEFIRTLNS